MLVAGFAPLERGRASSPHELSSRRDAVRARTSCWSFYARVNSICNLHNAILASYVGMPRRSSAILFGRHDRHRDGGATN